MGAIGAKVDKWGYLVNTSSDQCITAINDYYHQVLSYGRKKGVILEAPVHDGKCVLGNILAAHYLSSTRSSKASFFLHAAKSYYDESTTYERAIYNAISYLLLEERDDDIALELHFKLLKEFPRDLVSLKRAQILCFYMGDPHSSLDLVNKVVNENEGEEYIYGMLAFPLMELGFMDEAESVARKAIEITKKDTWAQHCLCHVLQHQCRFDEAVKFMEEYSQTWDSCSSLRYTHNWWHVAVCYLEGHSPIQKVLDVYDHSIMTELDRPDADRSEVYLEAAGLLLRLHIRGKASLIEGRLRSLSTLLTDKTIWFAEWQLDLFALWALATTGQLFPAHQLLQGLRISVSKMNRKKKALMKRVLSLAEGLYEYGRGNNDQALKMFGHDFDARDCKVIGASDEQLHVFNEVWYTLLLNSTSNATKVVEVIDRQLEKKNGAPFLWRLLEKAYLVSGKEENAKVAAEKANLLEGAYFPIVQ